GLDPSGRVRRPLAADPLPGEEPAAGRLRRKWSRRLGRRSLEDPLREGGAHAAASLLARGVPAASVADGPRLRQRAAALLAAGRGLALRAAGQREPLPFCPGPGSQRVAVRSAGVAALLSERHLYREAPLPPSPGGLRRPAQADRQERPLAAGDQPARAAVAAGSRALRAADESRGDAPRRETGAALQRL